MSIPTFAQNGKPVIFTTPFNIATARLKTAEIDNLEVQGRMALTLTAANDDDTITGSVVFTISDEGRGKLARQLDKSLSAIPASFIKKDINATFRKGTACPIAHIVIPATEFEAADAKIQINRVVIEINENQQQMTQLLCSWMRQINTGRKRKGIIAAINRLIAPEQEK